MFKRYRGKHKGKISWVKFCVFMGGFLLILGGVGAYELDHIPLITMICEAAGGLMLMGLAGLIDG